jgi:hypothetical protein
MAKDIGHVFKAGALVDHLRGGGMAVIPGAE